MSTKGQAYSGLPSAATATAVPVGLSHNISGKFGKDQVADETSTAFEADDSGMETPSSFVQGSQWAKGEVQTPGYRDSYFAIAFVLQLFVVFVSAVVLGGKGLSALSAGDISRRLEAFRLRSYEDPVRRLGDDDPYPADYNLVDDDTAGTYSNQEVDDEQPPSVAFFPSVVAVSLLCAPLLSVLALGLMAAHATSLIKFSLYFAVGINAILCLAMLVIVPPVAIVYGIFAAILVCYARAVWNRIPYAASNLRSAITAVRANMGVALLAFASLPLIAGWSACWFFALLGTMQTDFMKAQIDEESPYEGDDSSGDISALGTFIIILFSLSFYWTHQVIRNTVHTTIAGVIGTWWFTPIEASSFCSQGVKDSFVRSTTYSFGSICFGSLVVAIIQVLRDMLRNARNNRNGGVLVMCAHCLLVWIERLAEYFNKWAFIFVGLYGYGYIDAAKGVMSLFRSRGWTAIISDNLVNRLLAIVSLCIGLLVGLAALVVGLMAGGTDGWLGVAVVVGLLIGTILSSIMMGVVSSSVDAIIVCYAEAPEEFRENHPELHSEMEASWTEAWPDMSFARAVAVPQGGANPVLS